MTNDIRLLLLADSHLGFDLPVRARTGRRRRGHDFLANYRTALAPALAGGIDAVIHAGDVFNRPGIDPTLAWQAYDPLLRIAERGIPVFIVPGNHERSRLPHIRLVRHARVHVFERACTFAFDVRGTRITLSGFPFERKDVRTGFPALLERTGWQRERADVRLLCVHHCVEGATVGPADYMFRSAADVIRLRDLPADFAAVLSGHIHRQQVLTHDLSGRALEVPVLYPGSIERTSYAEADEPKGYMTVNLFDGGARRVDWQVCALPARPMLQTQLAADGLDGVQLEAAVRGLIDAAPADAVLGIRVTGAVAAADLRRISGPRLRALAPATMNVEIRVDVLQQLRWSARTGGRAYDSRRTADANLELDL